MSDITINKNNKSITFTHNNIGFSQFGVVDEILDLITDLQNKLQQKENIIKEAREKVNTIQFEVRSNDKKYSNLYITLKSTLQGQELLEILDKVSDE